MEELLVDHLKADAPLTAVVADRINWNTRPQLGSLPAVVLTKVSAVRNYHMLGSSNLVEARIQIDCWAVKFETAVGVARAIRNVLSGAQFSDTGTEVQGAFLDAERHFFEDQAAERLHRVSLDFIIWHSE